MSYIIDLQVACEDPLPVSHESLIQWAQLPLRSELDMAELTLRLVNVNEMLDLNATYRNQNKPTNVLAFPTAVPSGVSLDYPLLGDVIICPSVLLEESIQQQKDIEFHWAHITIHGVLHLLGFDHIRPEDERIMQALEVSLLATLGFANPYYQED